MEVLLFSPPFFPPSPNLLGGKTASIFIADVLGVKNNLLEGDLRMIIIKVPKIVKMPEEGLLKCLSVHILTSCPFIFSRGND